MKLAKQRILEWVTLTILDIKNMGGDWEVELDAKTGSKFVGTMDNISHPIHNSVLNILENQKEWPSGSADFKL